MTRGPAPELELLECLQAEDMSLHMTLTVLGYPFRDREHAKGAIAHYLLDGVLALYDGNDELRRTIQANKARWMLEDPSVWESNSAFRITLTEAGVDYWRSGAGATWFDDAESGRDEEPGSRA